MRGLLVGMGLLSRCFGHEEFLREKSVWEKKLAPPLDGRLPAKIQSLRVTETAHWLEWQDWADPILQQPYTIKDGHLHVPDVPGVGIEWNEDVVEAHRI